MTASNGSRPFTIVQLSDLHCGGQFFLPNLLERAISELNDLKPDIVVCSGDLTTMGFKEEYRSAKRYLDRIECKAVVVIPGNHDSRNVGYVHFEELFGERNSVLSVGRRHGRRRRLDRARPRQRPDRARPLPLDRGAVRGRRSGRAEDLRLPSPPATGSGHRPRAQHRLRRGRHDRVPAARRRQSRPQPATSTCRTRGGSRTSSSSTPAPSPVCVFAGRPALLQPDRDRRHPRRRLAEVPLPRPGADHPVLDETQAYEKYTGRIEYEVAKRS